MSAQANPYGTQLKYFLLEDYIPMRQMSANEVPEILRSNGKWDRYYDTWRFWHNANAVSREEFDAAVKEFLRDSQA